MITKNTIHGRIINHIKSKIEGYYNNLRIDRRDSRKIEKKLFPSGDAYWIHVANHIKSIVENDQANFFRDPEVILHLASENSGLGYGLLDKIRLHQSGSYILNKCCTSPWGAPFLLKNYPFLSPTTASHIANILSIYDLYGQNISSVLDFGGGYGGFARCIATLNPEVEINIVDLPEMNYVQNKFLDATTNFGKYNFFTDIDDLVSVKVDVFNASFSFSEIPLNYRKRVEKFVAQNAKSVHIIFQSEFNGINNLEYMDIFKKRLEAHGWSVDITKYDWYGDGSSAWLFSGHCKRAFAGVA